MPRLVEQLRQFWERFWALSWWWKGSISGGAVAVFVALIVVVVLATGGGDNTAVGGFGRGPTPAAQKATPTRVPTPNPTPTATPNPTLTPAQTATTSALGEQQPPSDGNPPTPAETPTQPPPAPSPTPKPASTPMPTPTATPTPAPYSTYWVLCGGRCWILTPEIQCVDYRYSSDIFRKACASPGFPAGCSNFLPSFCTPNPGWLVICDTFTTPTYIECDHSLDGSFSCGRSVTGGTICSSLANECTDVADSPFTCWRHDLGVEVTCRTTSPFGFACDSPTVGSFTCTEPESPLNSFNCP